ncbi:MAG: hypothetical protein ACMUEM_06020 [Flavobacteriales bacterium AspAUS03]
MISTSNLSWELRTKVTFNSGNLSGYEMEIHTYNSERKEFNLVGYEDERIRQAAQ